MVLMYIQTQTARYVTVAANSMYHVAKPSSYKITAYIDHKVHKYISELTASPVYQSSSKVDLADTHLGV